MRHNNKKKKLFIRLLRFMKIISLRDSAIVVKLFFTFSIVFFIMILLSSITFKNYKNDKEKSTLATIEQMNSQGVDKIDECFKDLDTITKLPLLQDDNTDNQFISKLGQFNQEINTRLESQKTFDTFAFKVFNYKSFIHSVFFYNLTGENVNRFFISNYLSVPEDTPVNEKWFSESLKGFGKQVIIDTYKMPGYVNSSNEAPIHVFAVSRGVVDVDAGKVIGVLLVNCKPNYLAGICDKMHIVPNQKTLIIGRNGNIVYERDETCLTQKADDSILRFIGEQPQNTRKADIEGVKYLISYDTSSSTGWRIVNIIPLNDLYKSIDRMRSATVFITFVLVLFTVFFLIFIIMQIVRPIKKLVLLMKLIKKGDFNVKLKFSSKDEIGRLARNFNSMVNKVNNLINEVYVQKIKQKDLELQMLQNQINPHFLYNTLESIHMMAIINKDPETSQMAVALGNILRYSIGGNQDKVTVQEEIEHLKDYIMLQKVRFEDIFHIEVDVDGSLYDKKIIKLILQPIVENAIYHGMDSVEYGGKIAVSGYEKENNIVFEVIDNGIGMDEAQVEKTNNYINDLDHTMKSIGLKNVNKRIQLHYSSEYGVKMFSEQGVGTRVRITIPIM